MGTKAENLTQQNIMGPPRAGLPSDMKESCDQILTNLYTRFDVLMPWKNLAISSKSKNIIPWYSQFSIPWCLKPL